MDNKNRKSGEGQKNSSVPSAELKPTSELKGLQAVKRPQLAHNARQMLLTRIAKYNDPKNLEWDWSDTTDKWERHALSAFRDLLDVEAERDALKEVIRLAGLRLTELNEPGSPVGAIRDELYAAWMNAEGITEQDIADTRTPTHWPE